MTNRKTIAAGALAALMAAGALVSTTESADARWRGRGAAVAAGVVGGLALGAIAASAAQPRYYDSGPGYGYYEPAYGPGYYAEPAPRYVYEPAPRYVYADPAPAYEPYDAYPARRSAQRPRSVDYGFHGPSTYGQSEGSQN